MANFTSRFHAPGLVSFAFVEGHTLQPGSFPPRLLF
jgi:hypothetical protein